MKFGLFLNRIRSAQFPTYRRVFTKKLVSIVANWDSSLAIEIRRI